jgi:hypothetical protein
MRPRVAAPGHALRRDPDSTDSAVNPGQTFGAGRQHGRAFRTTRGIAPQLTARLGPGYRAGARASCSGLKKRNASAAQALMQNMPHADPSMASVFAD